MLPVADQVGYYMRNAPIAPFFNGSNTPLGINPLVPTFNIVDIQSSNACQRNFTIFDQTKKRSRIMFHPETNCRMFYPSFGVEASIFQDKADEKDANDEKKVASPFKEDSADIDALLSMETETEECDGDDDVVSTAGTDATYACDSPDSCSNYEPLSKKSRPVFRKSCGSRCDDDKKWQRMRKMVKALKGVVPGANRTSTAADIDALLSMETETEECDGDDDVVSTAGTDATYACDSPDSCSNYEPLSKKSRPVFRKSCGSRCDDDKKWQRMRKMVKALKGVVPGANRTSTAAVLDEAVRYLKSMRMKVQMSIGNSKE